MSGQHVSDITDKSITHKRQFSDPGNADAHENAENNRPAQKKQKLDTDTIHTIQLTSHTKKLDIVILGYTDDDSRHNGMKVLDASKLDLSLLQCQNSDSYFEDDDEELLQASTIESCGPASWCDLTKYNVVGMYMFGATR